MFTVARINLAVPIAAALALGLAACDLSQKKPETVATMLATNRVGDAPATGSADVRAAPQGAAAESAGAERSVRLYGPGVSRERQTRI